ncbi:tyrosine-type recombinase/integrase [Saccharopolyspora griseoalba]|uniref:Tyrosine-type recombinase/integrase n=1 Tax=Saccharopolyspora griseoalba TaxID=1431848 RepID=A0ABW2LTP0_9PSEU
MTRTVAGQEGLPGHVSDLDALPHDERVQHLRVEVQAWLEGYSSQRTRESYAERLGVPRSWIPGRVTPDPQRRRGRRPRGYSGTEWLLWCWGNSVSYRDPSGDDVRRWLDELAERGYSPGTQVAWVSSVSSFYTHLIRGGLAASNPMAGATTSRRLSPAHPERVNEPFTLEQVRALREAAALLAPHARNGYRDRAMLELLAGTGMRAGELVELDLSSYERSTHGGAAVLVSCRCGGWHRLGVSTLVADAVEDYLALRCPPAVPAGEGDGRARQPLFVSNTGQRLHPKHVAYLLRQIIDAFTSGEPPRQRWKRELRASQAGIEVAAVLREIGPRGPERFRHRSGSPTPMCGSDTAT